jgi:hypothetical protein
MVTTTHTHWSSPRLALVAFVLALAAALFQALNPYAYSGESETGSSTGVVTQQSEHSSLISVNGFWQSVIPLAIPVALCAVALLLAMKGWRTPLWAFAITLAAYSFVTGFSIGLYFLPAAVVLVLAATRTPPRSARAAA